MSYAPSRRLLTSAWVRVCLRTLTHLAASLRHSCIYREYADQCGTVPYRIVPYCAMRMPNHQSVQFLVSTDGVVVLLCTDGSRRPLDHRPQLKMYTYLQCDVCHHHDDDTSYVPGYVSPWCQEHSTTSQTITALKGSG